MVRVIRLLVSEQLAQVLTERGGPVEVVGEDDALGAGHVLEHLGRALVDGHGARAEPGVDFFGDVVRLLRVLEREDEGVRGGALLLVALAPPRLGAGVIVVQARAVRVERDPPAREIVGDRGR